MFPQGSYRNRVNVRADSDVDVGVLYTDSFFAQYPEGESGESFGHKDASYTYGQFKDDVEEALVDYLGASMVTRGNKSIRLRETSYHVEADAAPFFEHRWYHAREEPPVPGVELRPDNRSWQRIINYPEALFDGWPKEHYENGRDKNGATRRRYRGMVRILKTIRNEMDEAGHGAAKDVPGYLLECLTWNCPDALFWHSEWDGRVQAVLSHLWSSTREGGNYLEWCEVDGIKYLFHGSQAWNRAKAHAFVDAAWDCVGVR